MPIYDTDDELSRTSSFSGSHDRMEQFEENRHRREYGHGQGDGKDKLWNGHSVGITSSSTYTVATDEEDNSDNTGENGNNHGKSNEEKQDELAARETQYVLMSKIGVVVVLVIFTFIFGMATYWSTSQRQIDNFESRVSSSLTD